MREELENLWSAMKDTHYKRTIDQLARSMKDTRHLEDALSAALDTVVNAIHAQAGTFWFYSRFTDGRIHPKAVYGGSDILDFSLLPGEGIAGQVIESGKSVIIADCQADPRWAGKVDKKTGFKTLTMICVPLKINDMVYGSIQIINKTDNLPFDSKDLSFTERLADEISPILKYQGLMEDYVKYSSGNKTEIEDEVTFKDVFCAKTEKEMEYNLRSIEEFSLLSVSRQNAVLKLTKEMRGYFINGRR